MKHLFAIFLLSFPLILAGCGVKRPLIAPRDIPAYEQKLEKKRLEREEFLREQEELRKRQLERERANPPSPKGA